MQNQIHVHVWKDGGFSKTEDNEITNISYGINPLRPTDAYMRQ